MSKYTRYGRRPPPKPRPWKIHPVWRGIGCLMFIIIPIMSYAGAVLLVEQNKTQGWMPMPYELMQTIFIPYIGGINHLYAYLLVCMLLMFVGFSVLMIVYALLYRLIGPPTIGPMDAPPERMQHKHWK